MRAILLFFSCFCWGVFLGFFSPLDGVKFFDSGQTPQLMIVWSTHCIFSVFSIVKFSHGMRKSVYNICEQQRRRSACASAQSDQHLCCSLPSFNISSFYIWNFKPLASLCSWTGRFESYLVTNSRRQVFSWRGSNIVWSTIAFAQ